MLNLNDLSISELNAYCDGIKDAVEILEASKPVNDRFFEAQRIIEIRLAEDFKNHAFEELSSKKNYEVKH